ncbi:hypothetical protein ZWY2020_056028 [Hordeum vulgare]|nr:hypothetical protein ZWY2020_056028 [Hordeum vulgare]
MNPALFSSSLQGFHDLLEVVVEKEAEKCSALFRGDCSDLSVTKQSRVEIVELLHTSFFRSLIVTTKTIATMILHPSLCQIEELLAWMECPNCKYCIDNTDPGLPAGVKFDPTDLELLEHLEGKVGRAASHVLIGGFIPTIEEAEGICYTHPENLPDSNGVIKVEKILVLYIGSRKGGGKTVKTNWRMHQYHLGVDQDEKQEELVVSKEGESRMSTVREAVEWLAGSSSHTVEDAVVSGLDEDLSRGRTPDAACPDPEGQLLPLDAEAPQGFADDLGAPPDISLPPQDMQLGSQDSMEMWLASVLTEDDEGFEVAAQQEEAGGWFFS